MPSHLETATTYGSSQGYAVRTRHLKTRPRHWGADWYAQADLVPGKVFVPRAELAWVGDIADEWLATCLWHEIGHCEQMSIRGDNIPLLRAPMDWKLDRWLIECDAWDRGLAAASEQGFVVTKECAETALTCLFSYLPPGAECPPIVDYLMEVAYGDECL